MGTALAVSFADNAIFQRAMAALQAGNFKDAERLFKDVLQTQPKHVAALNLLGVVLTQVGKFAEAETYLRLALQEFPKSDATLHNYGIVLKALHRPTEALDRFSQALALNPRAVETWNNRGNVLFELRRYDDAVAAYDKAAALQPNFIEAIYGRGNACAKLRRYDDAIAAYDKVLSSKPDLAEAWLGRGNVFVGLQRYNDALTAFDKALALDPNLAGAWLGRGNVLTEHKRCDDAFAAYDKALSLKPDLAEAWLGRGNLLTELKRHDDALVAYQKALALQPATAEAWLGRGNALTELKRYNDAFAAYERAMDLQPDFAEAWLGCGNVSAGLQQYSDALAAYEKAIALKPDLARAWLGRGNMFAQFARFQDATAAYDKALNLSPDLEHAAGNRLHAKLRICDWTDLEAETANLLSAIRERKKVSHPFSILSIPSSPADQLQCAEGYLASELPRFAPIWDRQAYSHDKIRVAYLSSDLRDHPIGYLTAGLFEQHDRARFEVTAISLATEQSSDFSRRIKAAFDRFIDCRLQSDQEIAEFVRQLEIDIIVDLNGFTQNGRPGVFARRPAPIQVNYLGYSGTMGADYFDYIIADPVVIPEQQFEFYSEKVVWLPDSFMVNDAARRIAARTPSRGELRLPEQEFVFCSFNQSYKLNPTIFDIWMRLLKHIDGSVLWMREDDATAPKNLRLEAERRGVASERLVFAPRAADIAEHLARQRQADLFLDTLPYNAHTTASDALWAGLPVVTCLGSTFAGRVAGSLLRACGLPELITESLPEYEALALTLAREPEHLASLKAKLALNRDTCPLFDTKRFVRQIEAAYHGMWHANLSGLPPASFAVGTSD
jgi:protein O-GlcNAc transferase